MDDETKTVRIEVGRVTIYSDRAVSGQPDGVVEQDEFLLESRETDGTTVSQSASLKLNLGNYESAGYMIAVTLPTTRDPVSIEKDAREAEKYIRGKMLDFVKAARAKATPA